METQQFIDQLNDKLNQTEKIFQTKLKQIRAVGAHPSLISELMIEYYQTPTPLGQISNITVPNATLLLVSPYDKDKSVVIDILKAISNSSLGLFASENEGVIKISVPSLTDEKRQIFVKQAKNLTEEAKISVRTVRQDINKKIQKAEISENEETIALDEVQKEVDIVNKRIEENFKTKEQELTKI